VIIVTNESESTAEKRKARFCPGLYYFWESFFRRLLPLR